MLFALYINNIILPNQYFDFHYFADDTILFGPGSTPAQAITPPQSACNEFQWSLISDKLVLNAEKTKYMFLSTSITTLNDTHITLTDS